MKAFYARLLLFSLPLLVVVGGPVLILYRAGEFTPARVVVRQQQSTRALLGTAYAERGRAHKLLSAIHRRPAVIVMGTSRVTQVRGEFFRDPSSFFNCGIGGLNVWHLRSFTEQIPREGLPEVILLGIEPWWFNAALADQRAQSFSYNSTKADFSEPEAADVLRDWWQVGRDLQSGKVHLGTVIRRERRPAIGTPIGMAAIMKGNGSRSDGSYRYADRMGPNPDDAGPDPATMFARLEKGEQWFAHGQTVSQPALQRLREFLAWCSQRRVHVVGFLPPYPQVVYKKLRAMPEYRYMWILRDELRPLFLEAGMPFFDLQNAADYGADDREFLDESHGSEVCLLRAVRLMARRDPALGKYVDEDRLQGILSRRLSRFDLGLEGAPEPSSLADGGVTGASASAQEYLRRQSEPAGLLHRDTP